MMYKILAGIAGSVLCITTQAQSFEEIKKQYPNKIAVFSTINRSVNIEYKKGVPFAESEEVTEMMILDDKANGTFNKDKVYHSSFNELKKIEAYTLLPEGNSIKKLKVTD